MGSEKQTLLTRNWHYVKQIIKRLVEMSRMEKPTPYCALSCIHELTASIFAHMRTYFYQTIIMADTHFCRTRRFNDGENGRGQLPYLVEYYPSSAGWATFLCCPAVPLRIA